MVQFRVSRLEFSKSCLVVLYAIYLELFGRVVSNVRLSGQIVGRCISIILRIVYYLLFICSFQYIHLDLSNMKKVVFVNFGVYNCEKINFINF